MADLGTQIQVAKGAGYSDADIAAHLATDPSLGPKIAQAKAAGYADADIVSHLAQSAPVQPQNAWQHAAQLIANEFNSASNAYRSDVQAAGAKAAQGQPLGLGDMAKPVLDAARAAYSPIKGVADAAFGDKPIVGGMTGGDLASFALPVAGELNAAREVGVAAKATGVGVDTMKATLAASKAPASIARAAPVSAAPANDLAAKVQQFDQAGVRPSLAAAHGGGAAKTANQVAENALAGGPARANMAGQVQDVQAAAGDLAQHYGAPADRAVTGEAVQQGIQNFNQRFSDRSGAMYDKAFNAIGAAQQEALDAAKSAADLKSAKGGATAIPAPVIAPTATTQALAAINGRGNSPALKDLFSSPQVQKLTQAIQDPGSLSFQDLRDARTWVREANNDDSLRASIGSGNLNKLEGALTQDINTNAATIAGPHAARQLQQADQFYRLGSQRIQNSLQAFVGKSGNAPGESAYDLIQRAASDKGGADSARLLALRNSLKPSEWGDVAATTIDRMGQPAAGAANANDPNAFSLGNFVSNYAKMSDRGQSILFGAQPGLKAQLDNLASVAGMVKNVEKGANVSNSGVSMQNFSTLSGLSAAAGSAGTALMTGHPIVATATIGSAAGGLLGMRLTGSMMTNPETVRWIARLGTAEKASPAAMSSAVGRLGSAARANPALVPLYQQAARLVQPPSVPAAATSTSPKGQTQ